MALPGHGATMLVITIGTHIIMIGILLGMTTVVMTTMGMTVTGNHIAIVVIHLDGM
jgi:hypothetical protein